MQTFVNLRWKAKPSKFRTVNMKIFKCIIREITSCSDLFWSTHNGVDKDARVILYFLIDINIFDLLRSFFQVVSSFLRCHIRRSFLQYSFNSIFNFTLSALLTVRTNFRPLNKRQISDSEICFLERLIALLLTNLPSNLSALYVAILLILPLSCFSSISGVLAWFSKIKILKDWKFRVRKCIKVIFEFEKRKVFINSLENHFLK